MSYLYTFLQSNLLEVLTLFIIVRQISKVEILKTVTLTNSLTHPIVFFVWMSLPLAYGVNIILAEVFAVVSEAEIYRRVWQVSFREAFWWSLIANIVSWQMGPILTWVFFYSGVI